MILQNYSVKIKSKAMDLTPISDYLIFLQDIKQLLPEKAMPTALTEVMFSSSKIASA